ncbi:MAG: hypothetical protein HOQ24_15785, partial [Mycobacteriaceae bacterium]|nr:hypothetical protein [Mycobacteriaceae bacterium]
HPLEGPHLHADPMDGVLAGMAANDFYHRAGSDRRVAAIPTAIGKNGLAPAELARTAGGRLEYFGEGATGLAAIGRRLLGADETQPVQDVDEPTRLANAERGMIVVKTAVGDSAPTPVEAYFVANQGGELVLFDYGGRFIGEFDPDRTSLPDKVAPDAHVYGIEFDADGTPVMPIDTRAATGAPDMADRTRMLRTVCVDDDTFRIDSGGAAQRALLEDPRLQSAVEDSLRLPDGSYRVFADPSTHPYGQLINGHGPSSHPGRTRNCLDCALAGLSSFQGVPEVAIPVPFEVGPDGELGSIELRTRAGTLTRSTRGLAWLGGRFERTMLDAPLDLAGNRQSAADAYGRLGERLLASGPGSAALVSVDWMQLDYYGKPALQDGQVVPCATNKGHAFLVVYPRGATGPVWWDPQVCGTWTKLPYQYVNNTFTMQYLFVPAPGSEPDLRPRGLPMYRNTYGTADAGVSAHLAHNDVLQLRMWPNAQTPSRAAMFDEVMAEFGAEANSVYFRLHSTIDPDELAAFTAAASESSHDHAAWQTEYGRLAAERGFTSLVRSHVIGLGSPDAVVDLEFSRAADPHARTAGSRVHTEGTDVGESPLQSAHGPPIRGPRRYTNDYGAGVAGVDAWLDDDGGLHLRMESTDDTPSDWGMLDDVMAALGGHVTSIHARLRSDNNADRITGFMSATTDQAIMDAAAVSRIGTLAQQRGFTDVEIVRVDTFDNGKVSTAEVRFVIPEQIDRYVESWTDAETGSLSYADKYGQLGYGIDAMVSPDGVLALAVRAGSQTPPGRSMFHDLMTAVGHKVTAINGSWTTGGFGVFTDNLDTFNAALQDLWLSPREAALHTFTGKLATEFGYTHVTFMLGPGTGEDAQIVPVFTKPGHEAAAYTEGHSRAAELVAGYHRNEQPELADAQYVARSLRFMVAQDIHYLRDRLPPIPSQRPSDSVLAEEVEVYAASLAHVRALRLAAADVHRLHRIMEHPSDAAEIEERIHAVEVALDELSRTPDVWATLRAVQERLAVVADSLRTLLPRSLRSVASP